MKLVIDGAAVEERLLGILDGKDSVVKFAADYGVTRQAAHAAIKRYTGFTLKELRVRNALGLSHPALAYIGRLRRRCN